METRKQRYQSRKPKRFLFNTVLLMLIAVIITFVIGFIKLMPSNEKVEYQPLQATPIFNNHQLTSYSAIIENDVVKLPLTFLNDVLIDYPIYYEAETDTIVLTAPDQVMRFKTESLNALLNEKEYTLTLKAEVIEGEVYLPSELIMEWYSINVHRLETDVIHVYSGEQTSQVAQVIKEKGTKLRQDADIKAPYYDTLPYNTELYVLDSQLDDWYFVQTFDGKSGFVQKSTTELMELITWKEQHPTQKYELPSLKDKKINLTWEAIYNRQPNLATMPSLEGVNVVSPTWFELINNKGTIQGKATHEYMNWAHDKGFHVWALFSNGFDPDWTTEVLSSVETRFHMIEQLVLFAKTYKFDGINIDFENVYTKDKENLVQFMRELTPIMHELGIIVSIDVTPKSNSEMWSVFLDRKALGQIVDYMMVMTYDEHWAASPVAGSVASIPWVERSIQRILEEDDVPPSKLILGIPLYTRLWTEAPQTDGSIKVSSKAIGMEAAEKIIVDNQLQKQYLEDVGQNYVEYNTEEGKKRIWLEDEKSIQNRIELVHKYDLAGIATWSRSFAKPSIWEVMDKALHQSNK